jgi:hypothetical protein
MRRIYIVLGILVLVLGIAIIYVTSAPDALNFMRSTQKVTDPAKMQSMALGWVGLPYTDDYQITHIPGYIDNHSGSTLASVDLQIWLLDSDGNRKEIVKYTVKDVPPGRRKTFDANAGPLKSSRTAKIKIDSITVVR